MEEAMPLFTNYRLSSMLVAAFLLFAGSALAAPRAYDPLVLSDQSRIETLDFLARDRARQRDIPLRVYLPPEKAAAPVVLFSHGLGGCRADYAYLGRHWALRGYVAVFLEHRGSDGLLRKGEPPAPGLSREKRGAGARNFLLRVKDVPFVLDRLEQWDRTEGHALVGRLDLGRIGMAGHSLGATTTQAVAGQAFPGGSFPYLDPRIKAAIALSPSCPSGRDPEEAFGSVKIPWMLMTGTRDGDVKSRMAVFAALPPGGKYELVLGGAGHEVFTDQIPPSEGGKRRHDFHETIIALSTAFWDAWLRGDGAAGLWLDSDGPDSVLEKDDRWQRK